MPDQVVQRPRFASGGDPDLVAVSGGSAGERLTSLAALWDGASPSQQVRADAPPFFVLQCTHDSLIFVQGARAFVRRPVACAELRGAACVRPRALDSHRVRGRRGAPFPRGLLE